MTKSWYQKYVRGCCEWEWGFKGFFAVSAFLINLVLHFLDKGWLSIDQCCFFRSRRASFFDHFYFRQCQGVFDSGAYFLKIRCTFLDLSHFFKNQYKAHFSRLRSHQLSLIKKNLFTKIKTKTFKKLNPLKINYTPHSHTHSLLCNLLL